MKVIKYSGSLENLSNRLSLVDDDNADIPDKWRVVPEEEYDWKVRLLLEWHELTIKHNKLFRYIKDEPLTNVSAPQFKLLLDQEAVMQKYIEIVTQRLTLAGVF